MRGPKSDTPQEIRVIRVVTDGRRAAGTDDLNHAVTTRCSRIPYALCFKRVISSSSRRGCTCCSSRRRPQASAHPELTKFGALRDGARAVVESRLTGEELKYEQELKSWGTVDVVGETGDVGIYRLNIAPGQCLPAHYHQQMREAEFVLDPGLSGQWDGANHTLMVGQRFWPRGQHTAIHWIKPSLLCIDQPTFIPEDERVVVEDINEFTAEGLVTGAGPDSDLGS